LCVSGLKLCLRALSSVLGSSEGSTYVQHVTSALSSVASTYLVHGILYLMACCTLCTLQTHFRQIVALVYRHYWRYYSVGCTTLLQLCCHSTKLVQMRLRAIGTLREYRHSTRSRRFWFPIFLVAGPLITPGASRTWGNQHGLNGSSRLYTVCMCVCVCA
jgi:hypothetical protein